METMRCKHHTDYDPASGDPTGTVQVDQDYIDHFQLEKCDPSKKMADQVFPCPYCWKARAKWLKERLAIAGWGVK